MKRLAGVLLAASIAVGVTAPVTLAADELRHDGRVLVSVGGDVSLPAGEHADVLVVVQGDATVSGEANVVVVVDGTASLEGATVESVWVVRGTVALEAGTTVLQDVRTLDATVERDPGAVVRGDVRGFEGDLVGLGFVLAPAVLLFTIGFALTMILAGLAVAAFAARQVREAGAVITREPLLTFLVGILGIIVPPVIAVLAAVTIVGIPTAIALLVVVWPALVFLGYLVAAIWIGDWLMARLRGAPEPGRPYLAAVLGVVALQVSSLIPPIPGIASLFGLGAVLLLGWRVARGSGPARPPVGAVAAA